MEVESEIAYRTALYAGSIGMLLLASAIVFFVFLYQRKLIKRKIAFLEIEEVLKQQELKTTYALLEGQDLERKRIAKELHDNLGSILVTLNMYADTALASDEQSKKDNFLARIREVASKASDETRQLSHRLDSAALQHFGLKTAVNELLDAVVEAKSIAVKRNIAEDVQVNSELSLNLYRVVQELINNTLKHAEAKTIHIDINMIKNDYISLIYEDDGKGMNRQYTPGLGLKNIQARIEQLNGESTIDTPSKGFCFTAEIPLP